MRDRWDGIAVGHAWPLTRAESGLAAALVLASAGTLDQYLGLGGVAAYAVAVAVAVPLALRLGLPLLAAHVDERRALVLAGATYLALAVAFALAYPRLNVHSGMRGSDRDDAATIAANHLMHLQYPYSTRTYLGNLVSQLPGAVILAVPFAALGSSAYQNLFWLPVLFLALARSLGDRRLALAALWIVVLGSPAVLRELLTGGDLIANNAYLIVFALGIAVEPTTRPRRAGRIASAVGLGLGLSSRANALLLVPLLFAVLARRGGVAVASRLVGLALAVWVAVTVPFWAYSPGGFSPLLTADKIGRLDTVLPHATWIVAGAGTLLALGLALSVRPRVAAALRAFALVQGVSLGASVVLASLAARSIDLGFLLLGYGMFALLPAAAALWSPEDGGTPSG